MPKRNMASLAENAKTKIPYEYDIGLDELTILMGKILSGDANKAFEAVSTAFQYGFVLGHRATRKGKIRVKL